MRPVWLLGAALVVLGVGVGSVLFLEDGDPRRSPPADTPAIDDPVAAITRASGPVREPPQARATVVVAPDARVAMDVAVRLAELGPRTAGSQTDPAARRLIAEELAAAGWTVVEEGFDLPQGGTSANVLAWRGDDPRGGPHRVVGAHHDTVPGAPGANDNASGVGVVVALAHRFADEEPAVPTVLVAFGAEELQPTDQHHIGSEAYAAAHAERVTGMVSVDMVGNASVRGSHCLCWYGDGPRVLADGLVTVADRAGADPVGVEPRGAISDHAPFARRGVPAVLLWSGPDPRYHSPADTAEHLRIRDLRRAAALVAAWLRDTD